MACVNVNSETSSCNALCYKIKFCTITREFRHGGQVYVDGEFIGGSDILMGLHQSNELEALLKGKSGGSDTTA